MNPPDNLFSGGSQLIRRDAVLIANQDNHGAPAFEALFREGGAHLPADFVAPEPGKQWPPRISAILSPFVDHGCGARPVTRQSLSPEIPCASVKLESGFHPLALAGQGNQKSNMTKETNLARNQPAETRYNIHTGVGGARRQWATRLRCALLDPPILMMGFWSTAAAVGHECLPWRGTILV